MNLCGNKIIGSEFESHLCIFTKLLLPPIVKRHGPSSIGLGRSFEQI